MSLKKLNKLYINFLFKILTRYSETLSIMYSEVHEQAGGIVASRFGDRKKTLMIFLKKYFHFQRFRKLKQIRNCE